MEVPIAYSQIEDVYIVSRWDASQKFCIRIVISDGSVLLQVCSDSCNTLPDNYSTLSLLSTHQMQPKPVHYIELFIITAVL